MEFTRIGVFSIILTRAGLLSSGSANADVGWGRN